MSSPANKSRFAPALMIGGGIATVGAIFFASKKSAQVTSAIEAQVAAPAVSLPPSPAVVAALPTFKARLTGYWPFKAGLTEAERKMEGGTKDRLGRPLITIEQHLADPVKYPYVAVAADDSIFPYGQRLVIDAWPNAIFRVVDTGGNFRGLKKVYRVVGAEPLDIAQLTADFKKPVTATVKIVPGDNFATKGLREVALAKFKDQTVAGFVEGRTTDDREVLARALESELGHRPREEMVAAAWAMRNRADEYGLTLMQLLAPLGAFGSPGQSGGYASTRKAATDRARDVAAEVLDAPVHYDPTGGAIEFWMPEEQARMRQLGDVHRAAKRVGDVAKAKKYERYAGYGDEGEVRARYAKNGLGVVSVIGAVELLGRTL